MSFSKDFIWGSATAAYQIEGAYNEDGKTDSIWDTFSKKNGVIFENHTGFTACDHYHRYKEDVALMKQAGLKHYRFSINWTRILPNGTGTINQKGVQFYDNLINELISAGIEPWITLFHWEYPEALYQRGGWLNEESPTWFEAYTKVLVDCFSDRVSHWFIINEPQCFASGHVNNWEHAPSVNFSPEQQMRMVRNILLSYGKAFLTIKTFAKKSAQVGLASTSNPAYPETNSAADIEAARIFTYDKKNEGQPLFSASLWCDPIFLGKYPKELLNDLAYVPVIKDGDWDLIHQVPDFYGVNHYHSLKVRMGKNGPEICKKPIGWAHTAMNWPYTPDAMYWMAKLHYERYQKPIIVSENGLASTDWLCADGKIHDGARIDYIGTHVRGLKKLADEGIPVAGYFYWSFMDNFEWAWGYSQRFGLVYVDYENQKRTLKDSAFFYKKVIESHGAILDTPEKWFTV